MANRVFQGGTFAITSVTPPSSNSQVLQGATFAIARLYEVVRVTKEYPISMYTPICGCFPVPFFTYEGN